MNDAVSISPIRAAEGERIAQEIRRTANRRHWRSLALASYATRPPIVDPPFYTYGQDLDALERRKELTEIETARLAYLREQRASGTIADAGETWKRELAAVGLLNRRYG